MDSRIFGKELTNLMGADIKSKKSYSHIHAEKHKDQSYNIPKPSHPKAHNKSLVLKEDKDTLKPDQNNPQMVPEYFH